MIILSAVLSNLLIIVNAQEILVNLPNGTVEGTQETTGGLGITYYAFKKIPYAKPPVEDLRFETPQTAEAWNGTRNGTALDVTCFQVAGDNSRSSEDCLFLNIYTTQHPSNITSLKPVWFFIHGGGFVRGSADIDPRHVLDYDIVFVSINYRLGPFGFLSTEDTVIPGNNGLRDQQLALRYIKENINLFGGDPDKITIGGQGAGASCASYQLLNSNNEGLFRGVIQESGSFLSPWSLQRDALWVAYETAAFISQNYIIDNTELLTFLKGVTAEELAAGSTNVWNKYGSILEDGIMYAPVIEVPHEGAFLTEKMYQKLRTGDFLNVSVLIGFNSEEEIEQAADMATVQDNAENFDFDSRYLVPEDMNLGDSYYLAFETGDSIASLYITESWFVDELGACIRYESDHLFIRSIIRQAQLQAKYCPVYLYEFSYQGELGFHYPEIEGAIGAAHSEEMNYMFGPDDAVTYNDADRKFHFRMVEMFTNFVKDLNPTSTQTEYLNINWDPVPSTGDEILFLNINQTSQMQSGPRKGTYAGWVEIYDSLNIEDILDTY